MQFAKSCRPSRDSSSNGFQTKNKSSALALGAFFLDLPGVSKNGAEIPLCDTDMPGVFNLMQIYVVCYRNQKGVEPMQDLYYYGMRNRGFSIGCQPMKGILWSEEDETGRYHDIIVYGRKLTDAEMRDFELDYIKGPNEMTITVDTSSLSMEDVTFPSSKVSVSASSSFAERSTRPWNASEVIL